MGLEAAKMGSELTNMGVKVTLDPGVYVTHRIQPMMHGFRVYLPTFKWWIFLVFMEEISHPRSFGKITRR